VKLGYDDAGSGDCVVLIHGHPFDRTMWQPQVAALRDGFRVVAPDLRGFGQSPVTQHLVTMREFAADIEELLYGPDCPASVPARVDAMMSAASPAGAAAALRGRAERPDYRGLLASLDIPALVCTGSADPWSDEAVTAGIIAHLKRPEPVVIDGAGHLPNLEAEDEFSDILRAFLRAHAPG
jgi:pimeloyl-ACP methyl ester carboxylesterase